MMFPSCGDFVSHPRYATKSYTMLVIKVLSSNCTYEVVTKKMMNGGRSDWRGNGP
jgi:hypothetical protein